MPKTAECFREKRFVGRWQHLERMLREGRQDIPRHVLVQETDRLHLARRWCHQISQHRAAIESFTFSVWLDDGVCGKMCHAARDVFGAVLDVD